MGVAKTGIAALEEGDALAGLGQVGQNLGLVLGQDLGADRNFQDDVVALAAGHVAAVPVRAFFRLEMLLVAEIDQGVEIGHAFDDDIAATAAVAAVGPAEFDIFLAPETAGPGPAVAAFDEDLNLVEELHLSRVRFEKGVGGRRRQSSSARRATVRPTQKRGMADHSPFSFVKATGKGPRYAAGSACATGSTDTKVRPNAFLAKVTRPSTSAKIV